MEISSEIIREVLDKSGTTMEHPQMAKIAASIYSKKLKEIVNISKHKKLRDADRDIHTIYSRLISRILIKDASAVNEFSQIIAICNSYLKKALKEADLNALFTLFYVNCYFKISITEYFKLLTISADEKETLRDKLVSLLKSVKMSTKVPATASYYEKQLKKEFNKALRDRDLERVYKLILAIERGGRGYHFNHLLETTTHFLFHLDFDAYVFQLNLLDHPEANVFYLQDLKYDQLILISSHSSSINCWTLIELIRQLCKNLKKDDAVDSARAKGVLNCLNVLHLKCSSFHAQSIPFFQDSPTFNSAFGQHLGFLDNTTITKTFSELLPIDKYDFHAAARLELLNNIPEGKVDLVLKTVFNRWSSFFDKLTHDKDYYQSSILLTDYADYIVNYYVRQVDDEDLKQMLIECISSAAWLNSEWFENESQQITKFNLYLTKIFLLSHGLAHKKLSDKVAQNMWPEVKNSAMYLRYVEKESTQVFEIIEKNLAV